MGGVEDNDLPPPKRIKESSLQAGALSNGSSFLELWSSCGVSMARPVSCNGKEEELVGPKRIVKKVEFVRLIANALYSLGYERSGVVLEEESGIPHHAPMADLFRKQILDGNLDDSVVTLHKIGLSAENIVKSASFLIFKLKFFEYLENDRYMDALNTLRNEITPLGISTKCLHELSSCIISPSQRLSLGFANLRIEASNTRLKLLEDLQKLLPPTLMVPERRLEHLVEKALCAQKEACYLHNTLDSCLSLYTDHHCGKDQLPSYTTQILQEHQDEIWFCLFSNQGKYLASSSTDKSAIVWEVCENGELKLKNKLIGHQKPVLMVAWSPDDNQLLTCGANEVMRRWNIHSGECLHVYEKAGFGLNSCGWFPDGKQLISGVSDKSTCIWELEGKETDSWEGHRTSGTSDVAVTKNGRHIIILYRDNAILLVDKVTKSEKLIEEDKSITSFSLSKDDNFVVANLINQEIHLWSIRGDPELIKSYRGHIRNRFLIRSCFGGFDQAFIASGSEDSQVYIWHRGTGNLVQALPGHTATVNCVSWNPSNHHMLASASDDCTIRIWGLTKNLKRKEACSNGVPHQCNGNSKMIKLN